MGREENISIFNDTTMSCTLNLSLVTAIHNSLQKQYFQAEEDVLDQVDKNIFSEPAKVVVSKNIR